MANTQYGARWVLDTAESVVATGTFVRIMALWFVGTSDVDDCILHDGAGKEIWKCKLGDVSVSGNQSGISFGTAGLVVDGMDLDIIDNGVLYVYLGKL
jgi:hypothetical protein